MSFLDTTRGILNQGQSVLGTSATTPPPGGSIFGDLQSRDVVRNGEYVIEYFDPLNPSVVVQTVPTGRIYNAPGGNGGGTPSGPNYQRVQGGDGQWYAVDMDNPGAPPIPIGVPGDTSTAVGPDWQRVQGGDGSWYAVDMNNPSAAPVRIDIPGESSGGTDWEYRSGPNGSTIYYDPANPQAGWRTLTAAAGAYNSPGGGTSAPYTAPSIPGINSGNSISVGGGGRRTPAATVLSPSLIDQASLNSSLDAMTRIQNLNLSYQQRSQAIANQPNLDERAYQEARAELDRQHDREMAILQAQLRAGESAADRQERYAAGFAEAINSVDPSALPAFLQAHGTIAQGLGRGANMLTDRALLPAANYLSLLNGGQGYNPNLPGGVAGSPGGGVPGGIPGAGGVPGNGSIGTPPVLDANGKPVLPSAPAAPAAPVAPMAPGPSGLDFSSLPESLAYVLRAYETLNPERFAAGNTSGIQTLQELTNDYYSRVGTGREGNFGGRIMPTEAEQERWANDWLNLMEQPDEQRTGGAIPAVDARLWQMGIPASAGSRNLIDAMQRTRQQIEALGGTQSNQRGVDILPGMYSYASGGASPEDQARIQELNEAYNQFYGATSPSYQQDWSQYGALGAQAAAAGLGLFENQNGVGSFAYQLDERGQPVPGTGFEWNPTNANAPFFDQEAVARRSGVPSYATDAATRAQTPEYQAGYGATIPYGADQIINGVPMMANGGRVNGPAIVGEAGPELLIPDRKGNVEVIPFSKIPGMATGGKIAPATTATTPALTTNAMPVPIVSPTPTVTAPVTIEAPKPPDATTTSTATSPFYQPGAPAPATAPPPPAATIPQVTVPPYLLPYLDQVRDTRTGVQYPNLNLMDPAYQFMYPSVRSANLLGLQSQYGTDPNDIQFEQAMWQPRGFSRLALGL